MKSLFRKDDTQQCCYTNEPFLFKKELILDKRIFSLLDHPFTKICYRKYVDAIGKQATKEIC